MPVSRGKKLGRNPAEIVAQLEPELLLGAGPEMAVKDGPSVGVGIAQPEPAPRRRLAGDDRFDCLSGVGPIHVLYSIQIKLFFRGISPPETIILGRKIAFKLGPESADLLHVRLLQGDILAWQQRGTSLPNYLKGTKPGLTNRSNRAKIHCQSGIEP
jgi:hypothetical protein